jgi:hypothetical protein
VNLTTTDLLVFALFGAVFVAAHVADRRLLRRDRRTVALLGQIDAAMVELSKHRELQADMRRGDWLLWLDKVTRREYHPLPKERAGR